VLREGPLSNRCKQKTPQVPYEYPHSGFQKLQTMQEEMRVTEPSVPPERAAPQSEGK